LFLGALFFRKEGSGRRGAGKEGNSSCLGTEKGRTSAVKSTEGLSCSLIRLGFGPKERKRGEGLLHTHRQSKKGKRREAPLHAGLAVKEKKYTHSSSLLKKVGGEKKGEDSNLAVLMEGREEALYQTVLERGESTHSAYYLRGQLWVKKGRINSLLFCSGEKKSRLCCDEEGPKTSSRCRRGKG